MLLLEDWLYERAKANNFRKPRASMREYLDHIPRNTLSKEEKARIERYTEIRNCLSHRGGLQMSATLTNELLDFMTLLFRREATIAEDLMTPHPHMVHTSDDLRKARDWMLENGVSRLPVVDQRDHVVGLLTNRDILSAAASTEAGKGDAITVGDAMSSDAEERVVYLSRRTAYEEILHHLRNPKVAAIFVTENGQKERPLLGIISASDLLPKL